MATKKRKVRRFEEGGNVGFFERLRMGNIDDPSSEAYRRFGAGRVPVEDRQFTPVTQEPTVTEAVRGNRPIEDELYQDRLPTSTETYTTKAPARASEEKPARAPAKAAPRAPAAADLSALKSSPQEMISRFVALERLKEPSGLRQESVQERAERYVAKRAAARAAEAAAEGPRGDDRILRNLKKPKPGEFTGMGGLQFSKGGKVSQASKRADGIAQRGKTRGRMV